MSKTLRRWSDLAVPPWARAFLYLEFAALSASIVASELSHAMLLLGFLAWRPWHPVQRRIPAWTLAPFAVLLAVAVVSALAGPAPLRGVALIGHDYRFYVVPFLVFFALPWSDTRRLIRVLASVVIIANLVAVAQYYLGPLHTFLGGPEHLDAVANRFRATAFFNHPLTYSGVMLVLAPLLGSLAHAERSSWRWLLAGSSAAAVLGVVLSATRSALLGLAAAAIVLLMRRSRRLAVAVVVSGVMVTGLAAALSGTDTMRGLFASGELPAVLKRLDPRVVAIGGEDRLLLWESAWRGVLDHLWLGVGSNNHYPTILQYQRAVSAEHGNYDFHQSWGASAHNVYLAMAFELGLAGLAAYLWMWGAIFAWAIRALRTLPDSSRWERALLWGALAGCVGSMIAGFFEDNSMDGEVQALLTVIFGLILHVGWSANVGPEADPAETPDRPSR